MNQPTERALENVIKYGAIFAEVSYPMWKPEGNGHLLVE